MASAAKVADDQPSVESDARRIISRSQAGGRFNVGPRVSPDGRQIAFFSEKDQFSVELFLADAETGRIERKLIHSATNPHFDSLQFINSAGAWSPDGRTLACERRARRQGLAGASRSQDRPRQARGAAARPGRCDSSVVLPRWTLGRPQRQSRRSVDLYLLSLDSGRLDPLTHDPFADLEPVFTPDGCAIVFVTERFSTNLTTLDPGPLRIARLDLATHEVMPIAGFLKGKQLSPQVSDDGSTLTFIAEPDGVSNLYRMPIDGGPIVQITSSSRASPASPRRAQRSHRRLSPDVWRSASSMTAAMSSTCSIRRNHDHRRARGRRSGGRFSRDERHRRATSSAC